MSEEIDYAEMLEIPVSTVNVVKKKSRRKREDIREQVIDKVNDKVNDEPPEDDGRSAESTVIEGEPTKTGKFFSLGSDKRSSIVLIAEFAAACLLCTTIFLTNIFMSDSAINTFLGGLFDSDTAQADNRSYSDFTLNSIVGEKSEVSVNVSANGVMSFTGESFVYPVCSGKVSSVTKDSDGERYTVSITHSRFVREHSYGARRMLLCRRRKREGEYSHRLFRRGERSQRNALRQRQSAQLLFGRRREQSHVEILKMTFPRAIVFLSSALRPP